MLRAFKKTLFFPETLNLSGNKLTDDGITALAQTLDYVYKNGFSHGYADTFIALGSNNISNVGIEALTDTCIPDNISLNNINMDNEGLAILSKIIERGWTDCCMVFNLENNQISDEGAIILAQALIKNRDLSEDEFDCTLFIDISLDKNQIGDDGAIALAKAIEYHTRACHWYFEENQIGNKRGYAFAKIFAEITVKYNHYIFNLSKNRINDEGAIAIAAVLKENKITPNRCSEIDLTGNNIGEEGKKALSEVNPKVCEITY